VNIESINFKDNIVYHYIGNGVRTAQPRFLNFTYEDFQYRVSGRTKERLKEGLKLKGVKFINNTFINSEYMFEITKLGMDTFNGFVFNDNNLTTDDKK
jgi:hypothetical protein